MPAVRVAAGFAALRKRKFSRLGKLLLTSTVNDDLLTPKPHEHPANGAAAKGVGTVNRIILAAAVALSMTACVHTSQYSPVVDHGISTGDYQTDLAECRELAQSSRASAGSNAAGGAIAGALLGALLGRAAGLSGDYTQRVAAVGAVQGGVAGGATAHNKQTEIVSNCIAGRGWNVVAS